MQRDRASSSRRRAGQNAVSEKEGEAGELTWIASTSTVGHETGSWKRSAIERCSSQLKIIESTIPRVLTADMLSLIGVGSRSVGCLGDELARVPTLDFYPNTLSPQHPSTTIIDSTLARLL